MGTWGPHSFMSDSCWDRLYAKNIHEIKGREIEHSIQEFWKKECPDGSRQIMLTGQASLNLVIDYIGIISWGLYHGRRIAEEHLNRARHALKTILDPEVIEWKGRDSHERVKALQIELKAVEQALANGGKIPRRDIPGIFDAMSGEPMLVKD